MIFQHLKISRIREPFLPCEFCILKLADMVHFRHLLSPKVKFDWTEALAKEFVLAKLNIVRKIHEGVGMFEVPRVTALVTDWA